VREDTVGIIAGSLALRDHAERHYGFAQVIASEYPALRALSPLEGRDDAARCRLAADRGCRHRGRSSESPADAGLLERYRHRTGARRG
jgi:hypothetical protein